MSPQLNGEPREAASTGARATTPENSDAAEASAHLPPALNTEGVTKTPVKGESDLAPLFASGATADFRARWDLVQRSFVDDPKRAVHAADELVEQVTRTLTESFAHQRAELEKSFAQTQAPNTESLHIALRQYRAFFERLLSL
jgi:hypothetical protein